MKSKVRGKSTNNPTMLARIGVVRALNRHGNQIDGWEL
jgi:hypothetical protein